MAAPSVTYTFIANTTADPTQVNQNFSDLIAALSDGTKTVTVSSLIATTGSITSTLAAAGAVTFSSTLAVTGAVTLTSTIKVNNQATLSTSNAKTLTSTDGTTTYPLVVSAAPATNALKIVRGTINSDGTTASGEGFACTANGSGVYSLAWSVAFGDVPAVTVNGSTSPAVFYFGVTSGTVSGATIRQSNSANQAFTFIAIGQRA